MAMTQQSGASETRGARMLIRALALRAWEQAGGSSAPPQFDDVSTRLLEHVDFAAEHDQPTLRRYLGIAKGVGTLPVATDHGLAGQTELLTRLVGRLQCNSQAVLDLSNNRVADLLLCPADFNHSCAPNCFASFPGMLTQGGQGGRPAPLASRLHRIPTHLLLNLHGI